jgi:hypothetical protein
VSCVLPRHEPNQTQGAGVGVELEPPDALPCRSRRAMVPPSHCATSTGRLEAQGRAFCTSP